jgi:hypothetical protein
MFFLEWAGDMILGDTLTFFGANTLALRRHL